MLLSWLRSLRGYLKIRISGYSPERFLNLCSHHKIYLWGLVPKDSAYDMYISVRDFRRLKPLLKKTNSKIRIIERYGAPFYLYHNRNRKFYYVGFALCGCFLWLYSTFIWDIHFEGNIYRTDPSLLTFLETMDVTPGMKKSEVDCEEIAQAVRKQFDDLVWVSASLNGSLLTIRVKENEDTLSPAENAAEDTPRDLVAEKDGVVLSMITRKGVPVVHEGDPVKAGDLLVSGRVEVLNDAGEVIDYQYQSSDADIIAATEQNYEDILSLTYQKKVYTEKEKKQYFFRIGAWRFSIGATNHSYKNSDSFVQEKQVVFGENLYLPVYYGYTQVKEYEFHKEKYTKEEVQNLLSQRFSLFCDELVKKGVQITGNSVKILIDKNLAAARGTLSLTEPIARFTDTEVITIERNESDESDGDND